MPKGSPELTKKRRDEIIRACAELYQTMRFGDITLREIANDTTLTRTSIYNYFQTKEEIFLALLQQEYELWTDELNALQPSGDGNRRQELAGKLAHTLERRERLLKLLSTNLQEIEENSRLECLVEFKISYGASIEALRECLGRFCPDMTEEAASDFVVSFFPLMYGIYPYSALTEKQKEAMKQAEIHCRSLSVYETAFIGIKGLLGV